MHASVALLSAVLDGAGNEEQDGAPQMHAAKIDADATPAMQVASSSPCPNVLGLLSAITLPVPEPGSFSHSCVSVLLSFCAGHDAKSAGDASSALCGEHCHQQ
jgi:hypothetical protein